MTSSPKFSSYRCFCYARPNLVLYPPLRLRAFAGVISLSHRDTGLPG